MSSPGNAEGNEHQGEEAKEDQANDEREQEGLVAGAGETWWKDGVIRSCCSGGGGLKVGEIKGEELDEELNPII